MPTIYIDNQQVEVPEGATVLVGYWGGEGSAGSLKALQATAEADADAANEDRGA